VLIAASRFAVVDPSSTQVYYPFVIQDGRAYIDTVFIKNGTITNAKIGDYIQSNNYVKETLGWKLFFDGTFEINGVVPKQGRMMITNRSMRFWDSNNVKRLQLGDLTE
jgi:hypothetical protein